MREQGLIETTESRGTVWGSFSTVQCLDYGWAQQQAGGGRASIYGCEDVDKLPDNHPERKKQLGINLRVSYPNIYLSGMRRGSILNLGNTALTETSLKYIDGQSIPRLLLTKECSCFGNFTSAQACVSWIYQPTLRCSVSTMGKRESYGNFIGTFPELGQ